LPALYEVAIDDEPSLVKFDATLALAWEIARGSTL
jgi:hypothetical protein